MPHEHSITDGAVDSNAGAAPGDLTAAGRSRVACACLTKPGNQPSQASGADANKACTCNMDCACSMACMFLQTGCQVSQTTQPSVGCSSLYQHHQLAISVCTSTTSAVATPRCGCYSALRQCAVPPLGTPALSYPFSSPNAPRFQTQMCPIPNCLTSPPCTPAMS